MSTISAITDVNGIEVGHAQDKEALTGCTVVLCRQGAGRPVRFFTGNVGQHRCTS